MSVFIAFSDLDVQDLLSAEDPSDLYDRNALREVVYDSL